MNFLYKLAQFKLSENAAAQGVHFLIGMNAVTVPAKWGVPHKFTSLIMLGAAAGIEFWFDAKYEKQPFSANLMDFGFYCLGILAGVLLTR